MLTSVLFALAHWGLGGLSIAQAFLAGSVLSSLYLKTGSLLPPILAHYLTNLIVYGWMYLESMPKS